MSMTPRHPEIDEHTIKLIVGVIALSLGNLTAAFAGAPLSSISASYYAGGWAQSIFVGFLFATASFLIAYNGQSAGELVASKVAGVAALGVALFPCDCDGHPPLVPYVHYTSAAVLFSILTYFCYCFFKRAWAKGHPQAKARAMIYAGCGAAMVVSLLTLVFDHIGGGSLTRLDPFLTFHCEYASLTAFGVSWLTASRVLPVLTRPDERVSLLPSAPRQ
jgi:hypothetical protein